MSKIAFIGQAGMFGKIALAEITKSSKIAEIRCISRRQRPESSNPNSSGAAIVQTQADFTSLESLLKALEGCTMLVSTMGTEGNYMETKKKLVEAAASAGLRYYITSDFGVDHQIPSTDLFQHSCWIDKSAHQKYAESLGLQTFSLYIGLFLQHPWGFADIWHGLDKEERVWYVAGKGDKEVTLTSKHDVARSLRAVIEKIIENPRTVPAKIRIKGTSKTPREIVETLNASLESAGSPDRWSIKPLLTDAEVDARLKCQLVAPEDPEELAALGPDFDPVFASEIAFRIFRAMGEGLILGSGDAHNEYRNQRVCV